MTVTTMKMPRALRIRAIEKAAKLGMATPEQLDELLASPTFTGADLADVLSANDHVTLTPEQWDIVIAREYFVIPLASITTLPADILTRLAKHPVQGVRDEIYLNPAATDDDRSIALKHGVSPDAIDGTRTQNRQRRALGRYNPGM